jgi:hypothetical protein
MITPRARRRPSPRTTATFSPAQRPKTRFPASTGRRCVARRVKRLHATATSPPPTYSHHVIICHNHLRAASGKGISGSARHDTHDRHSSHPSMLLARRSRRAADYKAAHEGHLNCHQGCQHSNTDQGKDVGGNCREVALVPRNKGCEQRFHGRSILLDFT